MGKEDQAVLAGSSPGRSSGQAAATGSMSTVECLKRLIAFDTTSRNSNLELIEWSRRGFAPKENE